MRHLARAVSKGARQAKSVGGDSRLTRHALFQRSLVAQPTSCAPRTPDSATYGELLPEGGDRALDEQHLNAPAATVLVEMGSGTGKLALQVHCGVAGVRGRTWRADMPVG